MSLKHTFVAATLLAGCTKEVPLPSSQLVPSMPTPTPVETPALNKPEEDVAMLPTLVNWITGRISETLYLESKPSVSLREEGVCDYSVVPIPKEHTSDLGYPRPMTGLDLTPFQGRFPGVVVWTPLSSVTPGSLLDSEVEGDTVSSVSTLISKGSGPLYGEVTAVEKRRFEAINLPAAPGVPNVYDVVTYVKDIVVRLTTYHPQGLEEFHLVPMQGAGSIINVGGKPTLLTAAHVFDLGLGAKKHDVAMTQSYGNVINDDIYVSTLHPTATNKSLMQKKVQLYFTRSRCTGSPYDPSYFVYDLIPTVNNTDTGSIYANVPQDMFTYMGGVSGAGVYYEGKLVGIYVGGSSTEKQGEALYARIIGIDVLRKLVEESAFDHEGPYIALGDE